MAELMSHNFADAATTGGLWIVIVNYRTPLLVIDCLRSIAPQTSELAGGKVLVMDNDSRDGSVDTIAAAIEREGWHSWACVTALPRNGGFSYGNNAGIRLALAGRAAYVMLLNPDTVVSDAAVHVLREFMQENLLTGIAGARLIDPDGGVDCSAHAFHSPLGELEGSARLGALSRLLKRHCVSPPVSDVARECDWVSGAAMVVRREVFDEVGLMDEGYFLYFEEVDLCWRAKHAGWKVSYVPGARIMHLEGASTGIKTRARRRASYWYESRRRFFVKHYGVFGLLGADLLWFCGRASFLVRRFLHLGAGQKVDDPARFMLDLLCGDLRALVRGDLRSISRESVPARAISDEELPAFAASSDRHAEPRERKSLCGIVVIGRNEGIRLHDCLGSMPAGVPVVYVDSGSSDGSAAHARGHGFDVIELDASKPFSAARARNAGAMRLAERFPEMEFIQFIDGDCLLRSEWLPAACEALAESSHRAVVVGELCERHPEASSYNRLCALEWRSPPGDISNFGALGGILMVRVTVFQAVGGFNEEVIAGEDSELGARLALAGYTVTKLGCPMATHDAAISRFGQWWTRAVRAGHAIGQRSYLNGKSALRDCVRERTSTWIWGIALPLTALIASVPTHGLSLALFGTYLVLFWRVLKFRRARGDNLDDAVLYARYLVLAKIANGIGLLKFYLNRKSRRYQLIEYK